MKACSFFGHRDTPQTDELKQKVRETVERLIVEEGGVIPFFLAVKVNLILFAIR